MGRWMFGSKALGFILLGMALWTDGSGSVSAQNSSNPAPVIPSVDIGGSTVAPVRRGTSASAPQEPAARIAPLPHGEGARRMGARLRTIFANYDWKADPNKPFERVAYLELLLTRPLSLRDEVTVRMELANEQLRAGRSAGAVETMTQLMRDLEPQEKSLDRSLMARLHELLALSYLRLGEQENCIGMHNALSCNFPLRGGGLHTKKQGAEGAVREYTIALELNPESQIDRWLLNLAYMQLGRYPQDVPKKWLADPALFKSDADIGYFPDVAGLAGVDAFQRSGGLIVEDLDGDGLLDILMSSSGPLDPMHFFHNNGDGTFSDRTAAAGLGSELGGLNMVLTDYNNDGCADVMVLRGGWWDVFGEYPMSLLRNNCDGTFDDVTEESGLLVNGPGQTAAWADYDGDGWLDVFVGHESRPGEQFVSQLFHNNHDGTFSQVAAPQAIGSAVAGVPGANLGFVKGVAWGDYNNDGRPDLYVSTMFGQSYLFRNDGPADPAHPDAARWKFTDVTEQAGLGGKRYTFPTWFFDYNNDGWLDIFAGGYSTTSMEDVGAFEMGKPHHASVSHLFRNNHDGTFTDLPRAAGLDRAITVMGANFGDLENDGWLDVYLGLGDPSFEALLPKRMFRNDEGRHFQDVTTSGGFGNLQKGHAIVFADLEGNGNEDVLEELGGAYPGDGFHAALYKNPGHGNHWVTLVLQGVRTNRPGYGARIRVETEEDGRVRSVYRAVGSVSSFGANPMRQHIGVGKAASIRAIEVWWPVSGRHQRFLNVAADRTYRVREDAERLEPVPVKSFEIGKSVIAPQHQHHE